MSPSDAQLMFIGELNNVGGLFKGALLQRPGRKFTHSPHTCGFAKIKAALALLLASPGWEAGLKNIQKEAQGGQGASRSVLSTLALEGCPTPPPPFLHPPHDLPEM